MARVAAIILAAGRGKRMEGRDKLLSSYRGRPLVDWIIDAAVTSKASNILIVTGHKGERLASLLDDRRIAAVGNPDFDSGMSSSIKAGIRALPRDIEGAIVCLADMPKLTAQHLDALIDAFTGGNICAPTYKGQRGNPVLWPRSRFSDLLTLEGDKGARDILKKLRNEITLVEMADDAILFDVDTPDVLET